jgi:hypothetical protein
MLNTVVPSAMLLFFILDLPCKAIGSVGHGYSLHPTAAPSCLCCVFNPVSYLDLVLQLAHLQLGSSLSAGQLGTQGGLLRADAGQGPAARTETSTASCI